MPFIDSFVQRWGVKLSFTALVSKFPSVMAQKGQQPDKPAAAGSFSIGVDESVI